MVKAVFGEGEAAHTPLHQTRRWLSAVTRRPVAAAPACAAAAIAAHLLRAKRRKLGAGELVGDDDMRGREREGHRRRLCDGSGEVVLERRVIVTVH